MNDAANHHVEYPDVYRHWSQKCEPFAGGDGLLTLLRQGWEVQDVIYSEEHWHSGARLVMVFHFELKSGDQSLEMPVLSNPFVRRFIRQEALTVKPVAERHLRRQRDADAV